MNKLATGAILVFFGFALFSFSTNHALSAQSDLQLSVELNRDLPSQTDSGATLSPSELVLTIEETVPVSGPCPLSLKRMEHIEAVNSLIIDLDSVEFCPLDTIGRRAAKLRWQLPFTMSAQGKINLVVNGNLLAQVEWSRDRARVIQLEEL